MSHPSITPKPLVPSDWLPLLQDVAVEIPAIASLLEKHIQLRLVIDANMVHEEIQWRLRSRREASNRTALHECVVAKVVILFAPNHLEREIQKRLADIAKRSGSDLEAAQREWQAFRELLHWYTPRSLKLPNNTRVADKDDLPYVAAWRELGADAVYSKDRHLVQMNAPTIKIALSPLRSYARGASVELAVQLGSVFTVAISIESVKAAIGFAGKAFRAFRELPPFLQLAIIGCLAFVLFDPKMRQRFAKLLDVLRRVSAPVIEALERLAHQLSISSVELSAPQIRALYAVPPRNKRSALVLARYICLVEKAPLSLAQLQEHMLDEGYRTKAQDFTFYLKRILRSSGQFTEGPAGMWALKTTAW